LVFAGIDEATRREWADGSSCRARTRQVLPEAARYLAPRP